jgi:hypothetical protein
MVGEQGNQEADESRWMFSGWRVGFDARRCEAQACHGHHLELKVIFEYGSFTCSRNGAGGCYRITFISPREGLKKMCAKSLSLSEEEQTADGDDEGR